MATTTTEPAQYDFDAAELEYHAGGWSINALANKYSIPEATLRRHAKKHGWVRGNVDLKRTMVREAMAGFSLDEQVTNDLTITQVRQLRADAASQDVADMNMGLTVARKCMAALLVMCDQVEHPKEVKLIVEANKGAVETIRKIRSLDADDAPEASVTVDIGDGFAELRAAFKRRLEQSTGDADASE
jgi:hypothetical protein